MSRLRRADNLVVIEPFKPFELLGLGLLVLGLLLVTFFFTQTNTGDIDRMAFMIGVTFLLAGALATFINRRVALDLNTREIVVHRTLYQPRRYKLDEAQSIQIVNAMRTPLFELWAVIISFQSGGFIMLATTFPAASVQFAAELAELTRLIPAVIRATPALIGEIEAAIGFAPRNGLWLLRGSVCIEQGDFAHGVLCFNHALSDDADQGPVRVLRATCLRHEGRYAEAVADLTLAERGGITCEQVYIERAQCFAKLGEHARAVEDWQWLLKRHENDPNLLLQLANAQSKIGQGELALATIHLAIIHCSRTLELHPFHEYLYALRGYAGLRAGDPNGSEKDIQRALELAPHSPIVVITVAAYYCIRAAAQPESRQVNLDKALAIVAGTRLSRECLLALAADDDCVPLVEHPRFQALLQRAVPGGVAQTQSG